MNRICIKNSYLFSFIVLLFLFYEEVSTAVFIVFGIKPSGVLNVVAVVMFSIALIIFILDFKFKYNIVTIRNLVLLLFIVILYVSSGIFYSNPNEHYYIVLISLLSLGFSAVIIGTRVSLIDSLAKIDDLLPFFIIPLSLIIGLFGQQHISNDEIMVRDSDTAGLSYQSFSYYMSYLYSYCFYYLFISPSRGDKSKIIFHCIIFPLMLFCAILTLKGGGRGAFVYFVIITLLLLFWIFLYFKKGRIKLFLVLVFFSFIFFVFSKYLGIYESAGFDRVLSTLFSDEYRDSSMHLAISVFKTSPFIGHGLGSIWWTVGIYSHNVFTDLLAETGVIGTVLFVYAIIITIRRLYFVSQKQVIFVLILLVFFGEIIMLQFSDYWLLSSKLFFTLSLAFSLSSKRDIYKNKGSFHFLQ